jgi:hypothetical protein
MFEQFKRKDHPVSKHSAIINGLVIFALKTILVRTGLKDSIRPGLRFYHIHYSALITLHCTMVICVIPLFRPYKTTGTRSAEFVVDRAAQT